ncbi:MAG: GGDEF domain-containing protein [Bacillota bacterium]|nr:GGDEF domain-containing protein [Bacillota bacterium]
MTGSTVSTFMIDVDNFKLYNDTYGHLEGDEVLKSVANIFKNHMDLRDGLSARFGGEEFVGACTGLTFEESQDLAERIRACVYDLNIEHIHSPLGRLTVSIGVSFAKGIDSSRKSELMRLADVLLYHAKNSGKNRVVIDYLNRSE